MKLTSSFFKKEAADRGFFISQLSADISNFHRYSVKTNQIFHYLRFDENYN